ncbi:MAG: phosphopyruvate hydratase [Candidatus Marinimicrobia bacterium]|nr:phosphopyruvate hydratase [Candidatus Neomarinimicrobiota bacterium]|tara:strand:- start:1218 stop:2510 length:1293 start_codon:yes stop_codon:yes gene_type:complete
MPKIKNINSRQIIDSRGNPTIEVDVHLKDGSFGRAAVPSGASTGSREALEMRDKEEFYLGKSVYKAIKNIDNIIFPALFNLNVQDYRNIDKVLIDLDGTLNKSNLGANAILGVSLACACAASNYQKKSFYEFIAKDNKISMPSPMMNIINGGSHADNNIDFQEFMIFPLGFESFSQALQAGVEIFHNLKNILKKKGLNTAVGDEGGFAPNLNSNEQALEFIIQSIELAGYKPGEEVFIALDIASSEFYDKANNFYVLKSEGKKLNSHELIDYYKYLIEKYPIISIEDGLDENDWQGWIEFNKNLGSSIQIVGDDLTVTNPLILKKAIDKEAINSILIKLNQIGTLSETLQAIDLAKQNELLTIISHRSGETEDTIIADLAVGTNAMQIKTGSLSRTDRTAKYNQLLRIEEKIINKTNYSGKEILKSITND